MKTTLFSTLLTVATSFALTCACGGSSAAPTRCSYGGKVFDAGDDFPSEDGCNTCSCMSDGNVACTAKACSSCDDIVTMYGALMGQAKTCDPGQPNQCAERVVAGLRCGCETFVDPSSFDADAIAALQAAYDAASCGDGIVCGPCAVPVSAHCSADRECVDE